MLVKRSVTLSGHRTSLALEPEFWAALERAAQAESVPLARLVARLDAARTGTGRSLGSAVRVWLLLRAEGAGAQPKDGQEPGAARP